MQKIPLKTHADISSQAGLKFDQSSSIHFLYSFYCQNLNTTGFLGEKSHRKIKCNLHKDLAKISPENALMLNARQFLVNEIFSLMIILSALSLPDTVKPV